MYKKLMNVVAVKTMRRTMLTLDVWWKRIEARHNAFKAHNATQRRDCHCTHCRHALQKDSRWYCSLAGTSGVFCLIS